MTQLLLRLFVKDIGKPGAAHVRTAVGSLSGAVGIVCNVLLFLGKLLAGTLAGSVSITADALNNLSDASGSIVTLLGFRVADKPADAHHPYGHARAEYLSGLVVAVMILVIGFELAKSSLEKILRPSGVEVSLLTLGILTASIVVKLWLYRFNRRLGELIGSSALAATAADSRNDCIATLGVLFSSLGEHFLNLRLDGFVGLAVAGFILVSGWNLARQTVSPLLGEGADPLLRQRILDYVAANPKVLGYHDLMVHDYGPGKRYASLHVEMDCREDPLECHDIIDDMERECLRSHNVHLVIHYDPVVTDDPARSALTEQLKTLLTEQDPRLRLHDFRMVQGKRHMNLLFDVILPWDLAGQEESIRTQVENALNGPDGRRYHVKITFDSSPE